MHERIRHKINNGQNYSSLIYQTDIKRIMSVIKTHSSIMDSCTRLGCLICRIAESDEFAAAAVAEQQY